MAKSPKKNPSMPLTNINQTEQPFGLRRHQIIEKKQETQISTEEKEKEWSDTPQDDI